MNQKTISKEKIGIVVSDTMKKTRSVMVERRFRHPFYEKTVIRKKKFMVHDQQEVSHTGDMVRICQTRPLSARKRWRLVEILKKAQTT